MFTAPLTKKWILVLSLLVPFRTFAAYTPVTCPEVSIKGSDCKSLVVEMGLSECPEGQDFKAMKITSCEGESATARLWTDEGIYKVTLAGKKDAKGVIGWKVTETTRQENAKKTETKTSTTVSVAVTPEAAKPAAPAPAPSIATPPPAPAPPPIPWADRISLSGHVRLRTDRSDFTDYATFRNPTYLRIRPNISLKINPEVDVVFEPQFSRTFGEAALTPNTTTANSTVQQGAVGNDPNLLMHQGYLSYRPLGWMTWTFGRQTLSYGDELVIGVSDWGNIGRSHDAVKVKMTYGWGQTDLFTSKVVYNDGTTKTGSGDISLHGIYNNFKIGKYLNNLDAYYFFKEDKFTGGTLGSLVQLSTAGLRFQAAFNGFDYRLEGNGQWRYPTVNRAFMLDGEVGYTLDTAIKPRLGLHAFQAGANYDILYPSNHSSLGFADVLGRRNNTGFAAHLSSNFFSSKLTVKFDYYHFRRTSDNMTAFKKAGTALGTLGSDSMDLGSEFDLTFIYKLNPALQLMTGVSIMDQGTYLEEEFNHKAPSFAYVQLLTKF